MLLRCTLIWGRPSQTPSPFVPGIDEQRDHPNWDPCAKWEDFRDDGDREFRMRIGEVHPLMSGVVIERVVEVKH